jgi:hypothetical protein
LPKRATVINRLGRRRSDRFAIISAQPSQPWLVSYSSFRAGFRAEPVLSGAAAVLLASFEQCPKYARITIGQRDRSDIRATPGFQPAYRNTAWILAPLDRAYRRASSINEQRALLAIAALADTQENIPPTTGMLARYQAQPGAQFPATLELMGVTHCRNQCGRSQGPNPFHFGQTLTTFILPKHARHFQVTLMDALIQVLKPRGHLAQHFAQQAAQLDFSIIEKVRQLAAQGCEAFAHHDPVLAEQAADSLASAVHHLIS